MKAILYLGQNSTLNKYNLKGSYLVGVDKGALILAQNKIKMDLAVGDFDSIENSDLSLIKKYSKDINILNPIKDDTDTRHAVELLYDKFDEILIIGGIQGKRIEHLIANINLLYLYPKLKYIDDFTEIEVLIKDKNYKKDQYKYISFFALKESIISLNGFKYNLDNYKLKPYDSLCISNEIKDNATIKISGMVLSIKSLEDNKK
jgi:thiamine pyrophosphokinase